MFRIMVARKKNLNVGITKKTRVKMDLHIPLNSQKVVVSLCGIELYRKCYLSGRPLLYAHSITELATFTFLGHNGSLPEIHSSTVSVAHISLKTHGLQNISVCTVTGQ